MISRWEDEPTLSPDRIPFCARIGDRTILCEAPGCGEPALLWPEAGDLRAFCRPHAPAYVRGYPRQRGAAMTKPTPPPACLTCSEPVSADELAHGERFCSFTCRVEWAMGRGSEVADWLAGFPTPAKALVAWEQLQHRMVQLAAAASVRNEVKR